MRLVLAVVLFSSLASAADDDRRMLLADIAREIREKYVDPDRGKTGVDELERRWKVPDFAKLDGPALVDRLNVDFQDVFHDKHLNIHPSRGDGKPPGPDRAQMKRMHHGFVSAMVLPGNIGYLNVIALADFEDPDTAKAIATSFEFVSGTDALLIDLRGNGGGDVDTVAEVVSYLVDGRVHLLDLYDRITGKKTADYTHDKVPGPRYGAKRPVFVLTSSRTFSGGEELAYDLQTLGRARLVGETTGGGANNNVFVPVGKGFVLSVPYGRVESPRTHGNWEGVGVKPDLPVARNEAFTAALRAAAQALLSVETDPRLRDRLQDLGDHPERVPDPLPR